MARIRTIKPEFFHSLTLAECSTRARLLFIGLWTHCDDEGRAVDEPRIIKGALFPLDDDVSARDVDADLMALEAVGAIHRYTVDGKRYLAVCNWQHQKIDRPSKSRIPAPPDSFDDDSTKARGGLDGNQRSDLGPRSDVPRTDDHDRTDEHDGEPDATNDVGQSSVEFETVISILTAHAEATTPAQIMNPRRWRDGTRSNLMAEQGDTIRAGLENGSTPQDIATDITGDGLGVRNAMRTLGLTVEAPAGWGAA